jgi:DNA polymerase-3 subunit epsilon
MYAIVDVETTGLSPAAEKITEIAHGKYTGFGFVDELLAKEDPSLLHDCIGPQHDNREVRRIINSYLKKNRNVKIVKY